MSDQPKPEVVRIGLVWIQVCVPEAFTDEQIEKFANTEAPTGIGSQWAIDRDQKLVRAKCDEREGCTHLVLKC